MKYVHTTENLENLELDGIILGVYAENVLGNSASRLSASIEEILKLDNFRAKPGSSLTLYNLNGVKSRRVVLVGLGKKEKCTSESVRIAASVGMRTLRKLGAKQVGIEHLNEDTTATAEGTVLGLFRYDKLKFNKKDKLKSLESVTYTGNNEDWKVGKYLSKGQNVARYLNETPANIANPTWVVKKAKKKLGELDNVEIEVYDEDWAKEQGMGAFLSVTAGTDQPAKFMVIKYNGGSDGDAPLAFVGKGITFDSGGISLKGSQGMGAMKGDMSGAGVVIGTLFAIAKLGLKTNVIGVTPLVENMPSGKATRPADVVSASNGKTIQIDNTDAEGRMVLSDALVYTEKTFKPHTVVDIATLTGAMMVALGNAFIGAFTRSDDLWKELEEVGKKAHDRFWRMPLDKMYRKLLDTPIADMKNVGGRAGGSCTAAMFLGEFIKMERWAHLDIAGNMSDEGKGYHPQGMTGKPVRALTRLAMKFVN